MEKASPLTPSRQRYLAEILALEAESGFARQSELAERLGVNRSSVTAVLRFLGERSLVFYEPYGVVTLTCEGRRMAESILDRRIIIKDYLVGIVEITEGAADKAARDMQCSVPDLVVDQFRARLPGERRASRRRAFRTNEILDANRE